MWYSDIWTSGDNWDEIEKSEEHYFWEKLKRERAVEELF